MKIRINKIVAAAFFIIGLFCLAILVTFVYQARMTPQTDGEYVALGSSFSAGLGLGEHTSGSPTVCMRSINSYPQQLARMLDYSLMDMSCSGATIKNVWHGGQAFLGPQIDAIGPNTKLVTLTAGGNDVNYVGDLGMLAYRYRIDLIKKFMGFRWNVEDKEFSQLERDMTDVLKEITRRAPSASVVLVTYPTLLPPIGNCVQTGISDEEAVLMRKVAKKFSEVQRAAALTANVILVEMEGVSIGHDICSQKPWVNGPSPTSGAPFHPTYLGAEGVADQVNLILKMID